MQEILLEITNNHLSGSILIRIIRFLDGIKVLFFVKRISLLCYNKGNTTYNKEERGTNGEGL